MYENNWKSVWTCICAFLFLIPLMGTAQTPNLVTGTVQSNTGEPIEGVSIVVKGSTAGTKTNATGEFKINVAGNGKLLLSNLGYSPQEIAVENRTVIQVVLQPVISNLNDIVVVGYGTARKSDLTGAVQRLTNDKFQNQSVTNIAEALSGTVAGVNLSQGTTASGGGKIEVRGTTSLKASNDPLIVLDGVIYNGQLGDINPGDIESIDILKDASSAAIYGARAASGILIVTTKRGKQGAVTVGVTAKVGIVGLTNVMRPMSPEQYLNARMDYQYQTYNQPAGYFNNPDNLPAGVTLDMWKNFDATPSNDVTDMWLNRLQVTETEKNNYKTGRTVDWYKEVLRNGIRKDYDLNISGGSKDISYYWSGGYTDNAGYILGDKFKTLRSRLNVDATLKEFFKIQVSAQFSDRNEGFQPASLDNAISASPYGSVNDANGNLAWYPHEETVAENPLMYYKYRDIYNKTQSLFTTIAGELKLPLGFSYRVAFSPRFSWQRSYFFDPVQTISGGQNNGYGARYTNSLYEWQVDNLIKWNKTFGAHRFDFTFLLNGEKYQSWADSLTNSQFAPSGALSYHSIGAGINPAISSNDQYSTGNAIMARLNYALKDKYLFTVTVRRDGYSAFGQGNPYATFPSAAFAWKLSREKFFHVNWVNNLKLRASWGLNGNREIGRYASLAQLSTTSYLYGNTLGVGVYSSTMANRNLRWETTEAINLGVDADMFDNRLSASVDYYSMRTTNLLIDRSLPSIIGYTSVAANLGEVRNKGVEITLNSRNIENGDQLRWNTSFVFSLNRNKIQHLYGDMVDVTDGSGNVTGQKEADDRNNNWFIGESLYRIWDYKREGVWQANEATAAAVYGQKPGNTKLRDVNDDGVLNPTDDKVFQGYTDPQYRLGLRNDFSFMKNFDFSFFIRADLGYFRENNIGEQAQWIKRRNILNAPYWSANNPGNEYPMVSSPFNAPYRFYQNSSFVRLQDVSLAYRIPAQKLAALKLSSVRAFMSLHNYFTISRWEHWDPESGMLPMPKNITFGVDVKF